MISKAKRITLGAIFIMIGAVVLRLVNPSNALLDDKDIEAILSGDMDVTYEMFGAAGDGVTNDYMAIKAAHDFANKLYVKNNYLVTVKANSSKTYYLGKMSQEIDVITNVDFNNATFVIDDYIDNNFNGKNDVNIEQAIFNVTNPMFVESKIKYINLIDQLDSSFKITPKTNDLSVLVSALKNNKYYIKNEYVRSQFDGNRYWGVTLVDKSVNYIQDFELKDNGSNVTEVLVFDSETGKLIVPVDYNYNDLLEVNVYPISNRNITIENGLFVTKTNNEVYSRSIRNKYTKRNILVNYTGNINISNISHEVLENSHKYTGKYQSINGNLYDGFIELDNTVKVQLDNVKLTPKTYTYYVIDGKESSVINDTSDLTINKSVIVNINNLDYYCDNDDDSICYKKYMLDNSKSSLLTSNYSKNISIDNSRINEIFVDKGITNLKVTNSTIGKGGIILTGKGIVDINNVTFDSSKNVINLNRNYGSSFDGDVLLNNVNYNITKVNDYVPSVIYSDNKENHDFGYISYFPNVYANNINIDTTNSGYSYIPFVKLDEDIANTIDGSKANNLYYFKENLILDKFNITNGSSLLLFNENFTNRQINLYQNSFGRNGTLNVYGNFNINPNLLLNADPKFAFGSKVEYEYTDIIASYNSKLDKLNKLDGYVSVGSIPSMISDYKDKISMVKFIKTDIDTINDKYTNALVGSKFNYNSKDDVYAYVMVEGEEIVLYFASDKNIYLENGYRLFKDFKLLNKVYLDNCILDNLTNTREMFSGCNYFDFDDDFVLLDKKINVASDMFKNVYKVNIDNDSSVILLKRLPASLLEVIYSGKMYNRNNTNLLSDNYGTGWYILGNNSKKYISIIGDINGDGIINVADVSKLDMFVKDNSKAKYDYERFAADVNFDSKITSEDSEELYRIVREDK